MTDADNGRCECGAALAYVSGAGASGVLCPECDADALAEITAEPPIVARIVSIDAAELEGMRARQRELEADLHEARSRLVTIVDEAFEPQPVMGMDELLSFLERSLNEQRATFANERLRLEVELREARAEVNGWELHAKASGIIAPVSEMLRELVALFEADPENEPLWRLLGLQELTTRLKAELAAEREKVSTAAKELAEARATVRRLEQDRNSEPARIEAARDACQAFEREMRRRGLQVVTLFPDDEHGRPKDNVRIIDKDGAPHWASSIWRAFEMAEGRYV